MLLEILEQTNYASFLSHYCTTKYDWSQYEWGRL